MLSRATAAKLLASAFLPYSRLLACIVGSYGCNAHAKDTMNALDCVNTLMDCMVPDLDALAANPNEYANMIFSGYTQTNEIISMKVSEYNYPIPIVNDLQRAQAGHEFEKAFCATYLQTLSVTKDFSHMLQADADVDTLAAAYYNEHPNCYWVTEGSIVHQYSIPLSSIACQYILKEHNPDGFFTRTHVFTELVLKTSS